MNQHGPFSMKMLVSCEGKNCAISYFRYPFECRAENFQKYAA